MSKTVKIEELIRMARACEDKATVVEEVTASRSRDEMFADALNNQSQLIGTLAEQLSRINLSQGQSQQLSISWQQQQWQNAGQRVCFKCGQTGHIAPICTNPLLPAEEQQRIRQETMGQGQGQLQSQGRYRQPQTNRSASETNRPIQPQGGAFGLESRC